MSPDGTPDEGPAQGQGPTTPTTTPSAHHEDKAARKARQRAEMKTDLKWASVALFVLVLVGGILFPPLARLVGFNTGDGGWGPWYSPTDGEEEMTNLTTEIFAQDGLVVPFEVLSVLLLAALVAGVVLALREPEGDA